MSPPRAHHAVQETRTRKHTHARVSRHHAHRGSHSAFTICQSPRVANRAHARYKRCGMGRLPGDRSRAEAFSLGHHDVTGPRTRRPPQARWIEPYSQEPAWHCIAAGSCTMGPRHQWWKTNPPVCSGAQFANETPLKPSVRARPANPTAELSVASSSSMCKMQHLAAELDVPCPQNAAPAPSTVPALMRPPSCAPVR